MTGAAVTKALQGALERNCQIRPMVTDGRAWTVAVQCVGFSRIPSPRYDGQLATRLAAASTIQVTNAATQENSRRSLQIPITLSLLPCLSLPCAGSSWHPKALLSSRSPTQELSKGARRGCSTRREFGLCGSARVLQRAAPFGMSLFIPEEGARRPIMKRLGVAKPAR